MSNKQQQRLFALDIACRALSNNENFCSEALESLEVLKGLRDDYRLIIKIALEEVGKFDEAKQYEETINQDTDLYRERKVNRPQDARQRTRNVRRSSNSTRNLYESLTGRQGPYDRLYQRTFERLRYITLTIK